MLRKTFSLSRGKVVASFVIAAVLGGVAWQFSQRIGAELRHRFVPGQRLVFRLDYVSASASDFAGLTRDVEANDGQQIFTTVEADLHATAREVDQTGALIVFTMRNPKVRVVVDGELALAQAEAIQADLAREVIAQVDSSGQIRTVQLDLAVTSLSHSFVRALLANTQFTLSEDTTDHKWQTREHDPNGEYTVQYERRRGSIFQPTVAVVTKTRLGYLPVKRTQSVRTLELNSHAEPTGTLTVLFDEAAGHVRSIDGRETTTIQVNGKTIARAETSLHLQFLRTETLSAAEFRTLTDRTARLRHEPAQALSASAPTKTQDAIIHRNELGDSTLASILADLSAFDAKGDSNSSDTALYFKLKALVYLQPRDCSCFAKILIAAKAESRTMQLITDALSSVGHAEAQSALQQAIRARSDDADAMALLIPALAMVETPTLTSEATLRELALETSNTATRQAAELGLGTMAHQLAGAAPARAAGLMRPIVEKLRTATTNESRRHYLFVLGNAGVPQTIDAIVAFAKDDSAEVRGAAVAALRWINAPGVNERICRALAGDSEDAVRAEAATALGFRAMTAETFAAQKQAFLSDRSTTVRVAALQNLVRAQGLFPEARTLLNQAANDNNETVRDEAAGLLAIE